MFPRIVLVACIAFSFALTRQDALGGDRPAMIGGGSTSVASLLHYPKKESAAKVEAALQFYCEVDANGRADHIAIVCARDKAPFRNAVEKALKNGRFVPASVGGKAVPVMLGGTVLFVNRDRPTIAVALATADRSKVTAMANYIQPQMIGSELDLRRRMWSKRHKIRFQAAVHPTAEVTAEIDARGNVTGKKIVNEDPKGAGIGEFLSKGFEDAKFIPALDNGRVVSGKFNYPYDFLGVRAPDSGPATGSVITHP